LSLEDLQEKFNDVSGHLEMLNFQLEEANYNNKLFKDIDDLVSRDSFKRIITDGYCKEEVIRNTMWLSDIRSRVKDKNNSMIGEDKDLDSRDRIQEKLLAISYFNEWFNGLYQGTSQAEGKVRAIEKEILEYKGILKEVSDSISGLN
jgi:hypothetical protein